MPKTPFLGTAYVARSHDLADQRLINLYLETVATKEGTAPGAFFSCPGLTLAVTLPTAPVRAAIPTTSGMYVIAGNTCYLVSESLSYTTLGTIGTTSGPAHIVSNGSQIGFFDAIGLHVLTQASTFVAVALPFSGEVGTPVCIDTLCLVNQVGSNIIWQSNVNDLTTWQFLNFTTEDGNAEPVVGLAVLHDQVVVFKPYSLCFYVNQGSSGFAFGRLPGLYPLVGCAAAATIVVLADRLYWLGQTKDTGPAFYQLSGAEPQPVSTYAIDNSLASYSAISDAFAFGYGQSGHSFYVATLPTGGDTWVFDSKESGALRMPVWHQRASFAGGQFGPYRGSCAATMAGQVYMGDTSSGSFYLLDLTRFTDNGAPRKWLRSWREAPEASHAPLRINWLEIQCETGITVPAGANPQMVLRQSFDSGATWSAELYASAGRTGETAALVRFNRLGATRRGVNSARVFELSSTDTFFTALMSAEVG